MATLVETLINLGLGKPAPLQRYRGEKSFITGTVLLGGIAGGACFDALCRNLREAEVTLARCNDQAGAEIERAAAHYGLQTTTAGGENEQSFAALIFDATAIRDAGQLTEVYRFLHPVLRRLATSGRVLLLGRPHRRAENAEQAAACRALEGLTRSIAKEIGRKGATAQLFHVEDGAENNIDAPLRFILSPKAAYIDGQALRVRRAASVECPDWQQPLQGRTALVTGASRGIGEAIARTLYRDGAEVVGLDVEAAREPLELVMADIDGTPLLIDITADDAPDTIAETLKMKGGVDIVVHNAGVTRDKTLANMPEHWWNMTIDINLAAAQRINRALLDADIIHRGGRIVGVSSMNGIAGQRGQSNYAASKAGVIGYVEFMGEELADHDIAVNAVAPGFIETQMTAAMPTMTREVGRRLNSLVQAGQPIDVAEAVAFFANPAANAINGSVLRVCGQNWLGA